MEFSLWVALQTFFLAYLEEPGKQVIFFIANSKRSHPWTEVCRHCTFPRVGRQGQLRKGQGHLFHAHPRMGDSQPSFTAGHKPSPHPQAESGCPGLPECPHATRQDTSLWHLFMVENWVGGKKDPFTLQHTSYIAWDCEVDVKSHESTFWIWVRFHASPLNCAWLCNGVEMLCFRYFFDVNSFLFSLIHVLVEKLPL